MVSSFAPAEPIPLYALLHPRKGKSQCVVSSFARAERQLSDIVSDSSKGSTLCVVSSSAPADLRQLSDTNHSSFIAVVGLA